jgi:hypothetical protein
VAFIDCVAFSVLRARGIAGRVAGGFARRHCYASVRDRAWFWFDFMTARPPTITTP